MKTTNPPITKIDRDIPIPPKMMGAGRVPRYPFASMQVGDSFLVSHNPKNITSYCLIFKRKLGHSYTTRKVAGGTRVWRVS